MTQPGETERSTGRLRGRGRSPTELMWGMVSQGASSFTNFGLSLVAARVLGAEGLGVVFVGFSLYLALLGIVRALLSDPLVALTTTRDEEDRETAQRSTLTILAFVSIGFAALTFLAGVLLSDPIGPGLIAIAPWLVPALLQDFWRIVLFQQRRGRAGALNDVSWAIVMAAAVPIAFRTGELWAVVACWGLGAAAGSILGFVQTGLRFVNGVSAGRWWRVTAWPMGRWLGLESLTTGLTTQSLVFIFAFLLGPTPLGGLRAVQSIYAPLGLIGAALTLPALPEIARRLVESAPRARQYAIRLGVLAGVLTASYIGLTVLVGGDLLNRVFGNGFANFEELIFPVGTTQMVGALFIGFPALLKAQQRTPALLVASVTGSVVMIAASTLLAMSAGIVGAAWGMALGMGVKGVLRASFAMRSSPRGSATLAAG